MTHGNAHHVRRWAAAAALAAVSLTANAQLSAADATAYERFWQQASGAGKQTIGFGSDGTPIGSPGVPQAGTDGGPGLRVDQSGTIKNPSGNPVNVTGSGRVPNGQIAGRIGSAMGKILPIAGTVLGVVELAELLAELGWGYQQGVGIGKFDPNVCSVAPCYAYSTRSVESTAIMTPYLSSKFAACDRARANFEARNASTGYAWRNPVKINSYTGTACVIADQNGVGISNSWNYATQTASPSAPVLIPGSILDLENEIASKSGWPTTSKMRRAAEKSAEITGERLKPEGVTVTGPASSPGPAPKIEQKPNPDGSTQQKTTTITHNHTYNTNVVTTTTTTVTNITNYGETGKTGTETTTEGAPAEEEPPKDPCEDNPERVGCKELGEPEGEVSKRTQDVSWAAENLGWGAGACPASPSWTDSLGSHTLNMGPICEAISSWVRPLVLAMAALMALAIAMPVIKET